MNKRIKSFQYAIKGIRSAFASEPNMKIHFAVALMVIAGGFLLDITLVEWLLCLICFGLVIGAEMFNSAIEKIIDLVSPEYHPIAGKVKDLAAGAVLICAIISGIIGLIIFLPKIWHYFIT